MISSRCKLDTKMGYMVVRGEEVRRIFLDEIAIVIIENPAVAMTGCLLSELMEPFRILIDRAVYDRKPEVLDKECKRYLANLLNSQIRIGGSHQTLLAGIGIYVRSVFDALSEEFFLRTSELLCRLEAYMEDLAFSLPCDIVCEKCSASSLIKSMGIHIREEYEDPLERLLDYMELVREFDRDKLFVLVGLRSFFSDAALEAFGKTALDHGFRMLWLDCVDRKNCQGKRG